MRAIPLFLTPRFSPRRPVLWFALGLWLTTLPAAQILSDEDIRNLTADDPAATEQTVPEDFSISRVLAQMFIALGAVLGFMALVVWAARKYVPAVKTMGSGSGIEILATRALGGRKHLMMVRARGKTILLGATQNGLTCLTELDMDTHEWSQAEAEADRAMDLEFGNGPTTHLEDR